MYLFHFYFIFDRNSCLTANSGKPDQMPCYAASDLGLHCLPRSHQKWVARHGRVKKQTAKTFMTIWATSWQNQKNGMCAQRTLRSAWASADSEDSDQTGRMLIWVFARRTCHFVCFVMRPLTSWKIILSNFEIINSKFLCCYMEFNSVCGHVQN